MKLVFLLSAINFGSLVFSIEGKSRASELKQSEKRFFQDEVHFDSNIEEVKVYCESILRQKENLIIMAHSLVNYDAEMLPEFVLNLEEAIQIYLEHSPLLESVSEVKVEGSEKLKDLIERALTVTILDLPEGTDEEIIVDSMSAEVSEVYTKIFLTMKNETFLQDWPFVKQFLHTWSNSDSDDILIDIDSSLETHTDILREIKVHESKGEIVHEINLPESPTLAAVSKPSKDGNDNVSDPLLNFVKILMKLEIFLGYKQ